MPSRTPITELDFFAVKDQFKEFLRSDPSVKFKDFDYDGSNMSVLLDVLAYNTYQSNFYTNMALSEMFLDSAQLENSVVSHAKELNYLPKSNTSAMAVVNLSITDADNPDSTIVLPENTRFSATLSSERYDFITNAVSIARKNAAGVYIVTGLEIFEGENVVERFTYTAASTKSLRIMNSSIDTSSLRVFETVDGALVEYKFSSDIFGVLPTDEVFYIQPSFDNTYEVVFGKNKFGKNPANNSRLTVFYRVTSGSDVNGACKFTTAFRSGVTVSLVSKASGGSMRESLEDIKFFAPRSIQVQERAVTERDYEILLKQKFNEIKDVSVIGGEDLDPPRFGKVAVAVNVEGGVTREKINLFTNYLRDKTPVSTGLIFLQPEFTYISLSANVFYNPNKTSKSEAQLENQVREILNAYSATSLDKFGAIFELSRVTSLIDASDNSISSNTILVDPYILYSPQTSVAQSPIFKFEAPLLNPYPVVREGNPETYESVVLSSPFIYENTRAIFEDNGLGGIHIREESNKQQGIPTFIRKNAGTVDYAAGSVRLSHFSAETLLNDGIRIYVKTQERNVTSPKSRILQLRDSDLTINIREISRNDR